MRKIELKSYASPLPTTPETTLTGSLLHPLRLRMTQHTWLLYALCGIIVLLFLICLMCIVIKHSKSIAHMYALLFVIMSIVDNRHAQH